MNNWIGEKMLDLMEHQVILQKRQADALGRIADALDRMFQMHNETERTEQWEANE